MLNNPPNRYLRGPLASLLLLGFGGFSTGCLSEETAEPSRSSAEIAPAPDSDLPVSETAIAGHDDRPGIRIDGERAYGYLKALCDLGPRPTGSPAMTAQQKLIADHFERLGATVELQKFALAHPQTRAKVPGANLIIRWNPDTTDRILLAAHYDTRPFPDRDPSRRKQRSGRFIGANDGASGTAILMELGHHMASLKSAYGVDFVLFDAEEFVFGNQRGQRYFIGSQYFARDYVKNPPAHRYRKAVLLDMVGDRRLQIYQDRNSVWWSDTRPITQEIWATAKRIGVKEFIPKTHPRMHRPLEDDHLMLRNVGKIPTCQIIDFDYPKYPTNRYWHAESDTPNKCSGESLAKVGSVVLEWMKTTQPPTPQAMDRR